MNPIVYPLMFGGAFLGLLLVRWPLITPATTTPQKVFIYTMGARLGAFLGVAIPFGLLFMRYAG